MQAEKLPMGRVPIWLVAIDETTSPRRAPISEFELEPVDGRLLGCRFRGVSFERVEAVLSNGIDVDPPDAASYVSSLDNAWEYGGLPKLVLAVDPIHLDRTFRTLGRTRRP
jgi:hypothetical protein